MAHKALYPLGLILLLLFSCGAPAPESYAPPLQRRQPPGVEPRPVGSFVSMSDVDADAHIVRDVSPGGDGSPWRWTFQRPELRFWVESVERQRLVVEFVIAENTFKQTGPVTVSFSVNGRLLGRQRCPKPGPYRFEKAVTSEWLRTDDFTMVTAEADRHWVAPEDGARLGFILSRIGFVR
ncbi:MAG: hypothetical protein FJW34_10875 [Acidobacteria bacterium]|nr:hypothetical protein [Acidobacteriota bacterium]